MGKEIVLLTGFAGFIGSQILRDLLARGYFVIGVDNLSEGSNENNYIDILDKYREDFHPFFLDMGSPTLETVLDEYLFEKIDYVINCGAQSHVDRSFSQYEKFISSNILGPINLANISLKRGVKKFIQVSTDEVFADSKQPFKENTRLSPQNAYSSSKASAELFLGNFHKAFGLPLVITNGANTYGERQLEEKIIPLAIKKLVTGEKVPLYKTKASRMWLHVENHASGIILAMEKGIVGRRYCLAPDPEDEMYTHDLIQKICHILDKNYEESIVLTPDRPNYDLRYLMSNKRAKTELGWIPDKHISEELENVVNHYKQKFTK